MLLTSGRGSSGFPSLGSCWCPRAPTCWELFEQGTPGMAHTGGMEGRRGKGLEVTFYLLCYSVLSPSEEIGLPPQEAEEGVHELGNREREEGKGAVSPGH